MEEKSLAYEMLEEIKRSNDKLESSNKRLFFVSLAELAIIIIMVIGFLVYESQYNYADESYQSVEDTDLNNSIINQKLGE